LIISGTTTVPPTLALPFLIDMVAAAAAVEIVNSDNPKIIIAL
jgi:hypothetical protein